MEMNKINLCLRQVRISSPLSLSLYSSVANSVVEINGSIFIFIDHDEYIVSIQILVNGFSLYTNGRRKNNFHT